MISAKKRIAIFFIVAVYALSLISGLVYILSNDILEAFAETDDSTYAYYYDNLTTTDKDGNVVDYTLAKKFYQVLEEVDASGDFKKGNLSKELTNILTSEQIAAWVEDGDLEIPRAFGAARDSFLMDHPELFYIDVYKIMISAGRTGGKYVAYIDSGKEANVYRNKAFTSEAAVNAAIIQYNNAIKSIADEITQKTEGFTGKRDKELSIALYEHFSSNSKNYFYDFGTYNDGMEGNASTASMAFTSYGALVNKRAVCSGFAMAYKAVMDYLNVPCIVVSGYSVGKDKKGVDLDNMVGHSWNYVKLETAPKESDASARASEKSYDWFAFDPTWGNVQSRGQYACMDAITASKHHMPYGVISSSNYSLNYPTLSSRIYDKAANPNEMNNEITIGDFDYKSFYKSAGTTFNVEEHVSYKGKNAKELFETENLRLISRSYYMYNGEKIWTKWQDIFNLSTKYSDQASGLENYDGYTFAYVNTNIQYTQYAVVSDVEPDLDRVFAEGAITWKKIEYSEGSIKDENIVFLSQKFENEVYGTYTPAPYLLNEATTPYMGCAITINDSMSESKGSNIMADKFATTITLKYTEPLHILDPNKPIVINVTPEKENAKQYCGFVKFSDGAVVHLLEDENGVANILQFKFKPSLMYEHDSMGYAFTFENVGSAKLVEKKTEDGNFVTTTSDKAPNYAYFEWARWFLACPKVFGDGRLWVECCAQPVLADNSDLSAMDFKDEDGNTTFSEAERSQMMLVVNDTRKETVDAMHDEITANPEINVTKDDIISSQTYDIQLSICGRVPKIPDGSYVKISLGFPEGYGPEDEGVTFKLFHRKHVKDDEYIIEEVPCVVTKFGIVATVTSFSPYMVAVVPEEKATTKTVYASIDGNGGKLTKEDGQIQTVKKGKSYTYSIAPDAGYKLYSVTLNGKSVIDRVVNGKLTLTYDELTRNNELEIQFISNEAAERYEEKGIVDPVKVVVSADNKTSDIYTFVEGEVFPEPTNVGVIIGISIAVVVVIAAAAVISVLLIKKRNSQQND